MATWRFFQGLRAEWRWYRLDDGGLVVAESDQGFAELRGCMANAETAGFTGETYQVHARQAGGFAGSRKSSDPHADDLPSPTAAHAAVDEQPAH